MFLFDEMLTKSEGVDSDVSRLDGMRDSEDDVALVARRWEGRGGVEEEVEYSWCHVRLWW